MKYYSTKDKACARAFSLREAVQAGLAPDGGLFVPERIPQADMAVAERLAGESYAALAGYLAELFFGDDIDPGLLRREMERIYDFPLPLRRVGSRYTLELFHGPTFAFKDYGATRAAPWRTGFTACRASRWCCSIPKGRSAGCRSAR